MAKISNYRNYHKLLVAEHRRHHQRHHQQQQKQQSQQQPQQPQIQHLHQPQHQQQCNQQHCLKQGQHTQDISVALGECEHSNTNNNNSKEYTFANCKTQQQQHVAKRRQHDVKYTKHVSTDQTIQHSKNFQQCQQTANSFAGRQQIVAAVSAFDQHYSDLKKWMQLTSNDYATTSNTKHFQSHNISNESTLLLGTYTSPPLSSVASASSSSSSSSTLTTIATTYSTYTTCSVLTYNLFAAYAEAATLQLRRKTSFNKILHVTGGRRHTTDMRSICYLILMAFVYWGVMIRAAVATNVNASLTTEAAVSRPLQIELSSNATMSTSNPPLMASGHGRFYGHGNIGGINSNSNSNSNSNNHRLQQHFPVSSVSSDILTNYQRRLLTRREAANVPDFDDDDSSYHDDDFDEYELLIRNKSAKGKYIGAPCNNMTCEATLLHVTCDKESQICGCERNYPVQLGLTRGCDKPKKLGEQCFYDETCKYNDENSLCVQVRHNAMCQCADGFHSVSYTKPSRRVFCTQDLDELNSDLPTLLGVCVGIGVLAGLICMVLHLFSKTKYPRHRNFGDANLPPPIMYSSETGIPLTVQSGRPSSRSSIRSSGGSIGSYGNRRSSTGGGNATSSSKGILVSTSRTGSRRPSLASVHSTSSSVRSYSMMRFEKEQQQKEIRQEMKLRLARLQQHQQQQHLGQYKPQIIIGDTALSMQHGIALGRITMATPSPMTPNSMDELLPSVDENQEYPPKLQPISNVCPDNVASATISAIRNAAVSTGTNPKLIASITTHTSANAGTGASLAEAASKTSDMASAAAYIGPCSSSTEAL